MKDNCVDVRDSDMYVASFGSGKKHLVVLPGLSDGLATVKGKALFLMPPYRRFLKYYTVSVFSRKNWMPEGYTIRQMADDQAEAMRALGMEKASVLGVSQGGMIAQYLAIDHPEIVDKLILAVTSPYTNDIAKEAVCTWVRMAEQGDHLSLMTDTAEKTYSRAYLEKNRKLFPLLAKITKPKTYERFFKNATAIVDFDARSELSKICCPTLILAGDDDRIVGNEAPYELHAGIPDSRLYIYEGLGHGAYEEGRDFYDRVYDFCEGS